MTQNIDFAEQVLAFMRGDWLDPTLDAETKRILQVLLIGVYIAHKRGQPLNKKAVRKLIGAEHADTATRYIRIACEKGLTVAKADKNDGRNSLLLPSATTSFHLAKKLDTLKAAQ